VFKKVSRESSYEGRSLIKKFKIKLNENIWQRLVKTELSPTTIKEW